MLIETVYLLTENVFF